jgi:hypothetical protein
VSTAPAPSGKRSAKHAAHDGRQRKQHERTGVGAGTVTAVIELRATRSGAGLGAFSGKTPQAPEARQGRSAQPVASGGEPGGDWWATAEHLADVAQGVVSVELTTAARSVLVGMTVELLTVLSCWPNTVQPANALVYLRTRRARMARHAAWFYDLPRHVRWFLAGTERVPPLVAFAVSAPTIDETASQLWRKALASLNGLTEPGEGPAPKPSAARTEPGQTGQPGCSDRDRRRRASGCQREIETPETAPRESVTTATAARACGNSPIGRRGGVVVGVSPRRTRGANAQAAHRVGSSAHGPKPATCGAQGGFAGRSTPGSEQPSRRYTTVSPRSFHPKTGRSPPPPLTCGALHRGGP